MNDDGERFGKRGPKPPPEPQPPGDPDHPWQQQGGNLNAAFLATVAAVFVAVGSGTFVFLNGGLSFLQPSERNAAPAYVSSVEKQCEKGWIENTLNVDQLHCYMTVSKNRLCDPRERAHLIATISRFQDDYSNWSARHFAASMGSIGKANMNMVEIGTSTADFERSMNDPSVSDEERMKKFERVDNVMGDVLDGPNKIMAEHRNDTPFYELEGDVTALASAGLLAEEDFEWGKPKFVKEGFAAVKSVRSVCAK